MDYEMPAEVLDFRKQVQEFIASHRTPELDTEIAAHHIHGYGPAARDFMQAMAREGLAAVAWPEEYGGQGKGALFLWALAEECSREGVPFDTLTFISVGPMIMRNGTEEQKQEILPKVLSGEINFAIGYTEPNAGTDLAALQTRATRDGDEYVVNGQKIWTSNGHLADYLWVPVRTDPDAPKHRGISALLIPTDLPGVEFRPLINMGREHGFNESFFEDVRVPVKNRIGDENRGWYVGATALDFERSGIAGSATVRRDVRELAEYLVTPEGRTYSSPKSPAALRRDVADAAIAAEVHYNLCLRIASMQDAGRVPNYEASMGKVFGTELTQRIARTTANSFGLYSNLWDEDDPRAPMSARGARSYVFSVPMTIAGGTSEIQRNIIATRGLGLPRT
jgi:alkylation response protein AidB-like acyl-CoA dehydrogenase